MYADETVPILPVVLHIPIATPRSTVGNSSAVNVYTTKKLMVTASLPIKAKAMVIQ